MLRMNTESTQVSKRLSKESTPASNPPRRGHAGWVSPSPVEDHDRVGRFDDGMRLAADTHVGRFDAGMRALRPDGRVGRFDDGMRALRPDSRVGRFDDGMRTLAADSRVGRFDAGMTTHSVESREHGDRRDDGIAEHPLAA